MELQNIRTRLSEHLAEITACLERINNTEEPHPLDTDILLSQIREMYCDALKLGAPAEKTSAERKTLAEEQPENTPEPTHEDTQTEGTFVPQVEPQVVEDEVVTEQKTVIAEQQPVITYEIEDIFSEFSEMEYGGHKKDKAENPTPQTEEKVVVEEEEPSAVQTTEEFTETVQEPEDETANDIAEKVMNRKTVIENIVALQQSSNAETAENTQLSLLDYLPGVSRVVENVDKQTIPPAPKTIAEKFAERQHQTSTLNTPPTANTIAKAHPDTPSKFVDLRTIIGINDKFTYINDLFEKDMRSYNEFINTLNKIDDVPEAQKFVQGVADKYNWKKESMAVQLFMSAYKRRYSAPLNLV